jgi:putative ABC transport system ATP-binding protein
VRPEADIRVESVSRQFPTPSGPVWAVDDVTVAVPAGTSIAIMGPSGCGKSTLLAIIGGLDVPSSGRVFIGEQEISALRDRERTRIRRELMGLVFQDDNLQPFLTAVENVSLQLELHGTTRGFDRGDELLVELGLADCRDKLPDQMSGGQRQRVAIARALVTGPRIVLADEPTGAETAGVVLDLLVEVSRTSGATLVVVTHEPSVAARLDEVVVLRDGRLDPDAASAAAPGR